MLENLAHGWTRGECSAAAAIVAGAVGFLQSYSKSLSGEEADVEDVLGLLRATARDYRTDPTVGATCPADSCPREFYGTGMINVGAAAEMLRRKFLSQELFEEQTVTSDTYGWQFVPIDTAWGGNDTTWVQFRASATVYITHRSEGVDDSEMPLRLAWVRKKSANAFAGYPYYMDDRVKLARLGVRDCYLYGIDPYGQATITGYTYAWRIGTGPLHFLIPENEMRLTYCCVRGAVDSADGPGRSEAFAFRVWPNPAPSRVSIFLSGPRPPDLRLELFDSAGRLVRTLPADGILATGRLNWDCRGTDGRALPSGTYWIRGASGGGAMVERIVIVR